MAPARETRTRLTPAPLPQAPLDDAQRLACLRLIRSNEGACALTGNDQSAGLQRRHGLAHHGAADAHARHHFLLGRKLGAGRQFAGDDLLGKPVGDFFAPDSVASHRALKRSVTAR